MKKFLSSGQAKNSLMRRASRVAVLSFFSLMIATPLASFAATADVVAPSAPTLNGPDQGEVVVEKSPVITGWVTDGLLVEVHIDGQFNGWATIQESDTGTDSFYYTPFLPLSAGAHALHLRSKDPKTGARSKPTQEIIFRVADALPAPTLLDPVVDASAPQQPTVVGLTYGGTTVEVFVDGESQGSVTVDGEPTEVRDFALQTAVLTAGTEHLVHAVASDTMGRVSIESAKKSVIVSGSSDEAVSSTEETTEDDTVNEIVLGETTDADDDADTATSDEAVDADNDADSADANGENANAVATTDDDEDDADRSALVTWIVVIAVLVVILALRLRGNGSAQTSFDAAARSVFKDGKDPSKDSHNDSKKDDVPPPPPPPSSSSY